MASLSSQAAEGGVARLQAILRGKHAREVHVKRLKEGAYASKRACLCACVDVHIPTSPVLQLHLACSFQVK